MGRGDARQIESAGEDAFNPELLRFTDDEVEDLDYFEMPIGFAIILTFAVVLLLL